MGGGGGGGPEPGGRSDGDTWGGRWAGSLEGSEPVSDDSAVRSAGRRRHTDERKQTQLNVLKTRMCVGHT